MIPIADPGDSAYYTVEFEGLGEATIVSATVTLPAPLAQVGDVIIDNQTSPTAVTVRISGAQHGNVYQCEVAATLSTTEIVNRQFTLVGFNS